MRKYLVMLAIVLAVLHQDFWLWDSTTLVFGFLPMGLAYHMAYSLVVAGFGYLCIRYAWPVKDEAEGEQP